MGRVEIYCKVKCNLDKIFTQAVRAAKQLIKNYGTDREEIVPFDIDGHARKVA